MPQLIPRSRQLGAALVLAAGLLLPASAAAQYADSTLFAVNTGTAIYTVNRLTGAATNIGTLAFATSALARHPGTGNLYYTSNAAPLGRVAYWNPATGTNTVINAAGNGDITVRLTFNSAGELYGIGDTPSMLYRIDAATGAYTALGEVRVGTRTGPDLGSSGDLAFDYDGTLYVAANDPNRGGDASLYVLSLVPQTGRYVATFVNGYATLTQAALAFVADGRLESGGVNQAMYVVSKTGGATITLVTGGPIQYADFATAPRFADLSVSGTTAGLPRGGTATYTITVGNSGPQSANGPITVVDSLPVGLTYTGVTGAGWSCSAVGRRVTCTTPGPLAVGATTSFALSAAVAAGATGTVLTNVLRVTGSTIDHDQTDNRATVAGTTVANVVMTLNKSHAGDFTVGTNGVYSISMQNTGTYASTGTITVVDTLPVGMLLVGGTGTGFTCTFAGTSPQVITCTYPGSIAVGATVTASLTVSVGAAAAPGVTNRIWAMGGGQLAPASDADPTVVNTIMVDVTPDAGAEQRLPSNGTSYAGSFTVSNPGGAPTTYSLAATKAPGTIITITAVNGTAGSAGSVSLAAGASVVVPVTYTVATAAPTGATDTLRLVATAASSPSVSDPGAIVVSVIRAGLAMTKQPFRDDQVTAIPVDGQVSPGEFIQFRITVTATGAAGSTLVKVADPLPAGVTFVSATGDLAGWTIANAAGTVSADLAGPLSAGQSRFFWVRVKVD